MLQIVRGLLVGRAVEDLALHVVSEDFGPRIAVDGIELRKGLDGDPESYSPADNCGRVISKTGYGCASGFIDEKKHRGAALSCPFVISGHKLVNEGSPEESDQGDNARRSRSGQRRYTVMGFCEV